MGLVTKGVELKRLIGQKTSLYYGMLMWKLIGKQAMLMNE